jgi:hypothetical protein
MKYVDGNVNNDIQIDNYLFDKTGNVLKGEAEHKIPHYAKKIYNTATDRETYYIRIHAGAPLDPNGPYGRRERNLDTNMKRVSKNTFDFYITYLKTNNSIYLTKANRGFLND